MKPTERFSSRVADYVKYRPGYPHGVLELLRAECGLTERSVVADVGSGTGILSEMFLHAGNPVYGIEPNAEMRAAAERQLAGFPGFTSFAATAEETTLPAASVDFVVAAQAFHWFDRTRARAEFARILKVGGWLVLIWNTRRVGDACSPFERDYERMLLDFGTDYEAVRHADIDLAAVQQFVGDSPVTRHALENQQVFDLDGIEGRLRSSSYTPEPSDSRFAPMMERLRQIFAANQRDSRVSFQYDTEVYCARL